MLLQSIFHLKRYARVFAMQQLAHRNICRILAVKGISSDLSDEEINAMFSSFGKVKEVITLPQPVDSPFIIAKQIFVEFNALSSAIACYEELNYTMVYNKRLYIDYATFRPQTYDLQNFINRHKQNSMKQSSKKAE